MEVIVQEICECFLVLTLAESFGASLEELKQNHGVRPENNNLWSFILNAST
jgi:hypothetical protein